MQETVDSESGEGPVVSQMTGKREDGSASTPEEGSAAKQNTTEPEKIESTAAAAGEIMPEKAAGTGEGEIPAEPETSAMADALEDAPWGGKLEIPDGVVYERPMNRGMLRSASRPSESVTVHWPGGPLYYENGEWFTREFQIVTNSDGASHLGYCGNALPDAPCRRQRG